jgi:7-cyano-7-deazaguanine synthase in queuosine biosynthesis
MELDRIEQLLEKYFDAETSIAEENELRDYFSSPDVAQHLEQYQSMFTFFTNAKEETSAGLKPLQSKKRNVAWLSLAASVVVLLGIGTFTFLNQEKDLGTYDNPEVAFRETQKALQLLSGNVNKGVESVQYVGAYETAKKQVFNE